MFDLFDEHGILITFLSYQENGEKKYHFYFRDTSNGALYNPLSTNEKGKKYHIPYDDFYEGLSVYVEAAKKYVESGKKKDDLGRAFLS